MAKTKTKTKTLDTIWEVDDTLWSIIEPILIAFWPRKRTGRPPACYETLSAARPHRDSSCGIPDCIARTLLKLESPNESGSWLYELVSILRRLRLVPRAKARAGDALLNRRDLLQIEKLCVRQPAIALGVAG